MADEPSSIPVAIAKDDERGGRNSAAAKLQQAKSSGAIKLSKPLPSLRRARFNAEPEDDNQHTCESEGEPKKTEDAKALDSRQHPQEL